MTDRSANSSTLFERIWPSALLIAGLAVTLAWVGLVVYALVGLIGTTL